MSVFMRPGEGGRNRTCRLTNPGRRQDPAGEGGASGCLRAQQTGTERVSTVPRPASLRPRGQRLETDLALARLVVTANGKGRRL